MEVCLYLDLLYGLYALDCEYEDEAAAVFSALVRQLAAVNHRTADLLSAKVYYYFALSHERLQADATVTPVSAGGAGLSSSSGLLPVLLSSYRSCCLQHNEPGQAALINCILRFYLQQRSYSLADTFRLKSSYPAELRLISSAVYARYCYYVGKILCIQLAYSDAFSSLQQARRKAPQHSQQARHFKYAISVLLVLTQLLMGEIPDRAQFNDSGRSQQQQLATITALTRANSLGNTKTAAASQVLTSASASPTAAAAAAAAAADASQPAAAAAAGDAPQPAAAVAPSSSSSSSLSLYPYLCLTRAVRVGDLGGFHSVTSRFQSVFQRDDVASLIVRLRHNVIKAGLRKVNLSYSAIPLSAICSRLALDDGLAADAESLLVKAISDGVIEASMDPLTAAVYSSPSPAVYASAAPQQAFHRRITFALDIHTEAVRAMSFPSSAAGRQLLAGAAAAEQGDDDDDDEDSLAALQRRERKEKEDKERKEKDRDGKDGKHGKDSKGGSKDSK